MTMRAEPAMADLAVVGAGPAGLAAAAAAAEAGASVLLVDGSAHAGGQYWRHGTGPSDHRLHHGWSTFTRLRQRVESAGATLLARA
jgi:NADPH-dependent 2,4-dienoyl-CoA reductase/sulfur reductase-like enzyme